MKKTAAMIIIALGAGLIGSLFTAPGLQWYESLNKPVFNPPAWIFAPVWTALYVMMGIAAGIVWSKTSLASKPMQWYFFQLVLNVGWSAAFFGLHLPGLALICIVLLWASIFMTMNSFREVSGKAYQLILPYLAWVTFAALLNFAVMVLN